MIKVRGGHAKRTLDVTGSVAGLIAVSPLLLVAALAILATDGRPVMFRQERVGREGVRFSILKLRTMRARVPGIEVSSDRDPRITRVGALLRKTKIDELPQLVNVLRGDMSLVGPRPEVIRYVEYWPDRQRQAILSVRPGITDPASIVFRNESEMLGASDDPESTYIEDILPRKVEMYVDYVSSQSLLGDIEILLRTALLVVKA